MTQAGDRGAHGVRQPSETLPDLGDRRALGSLEHADQQRTLCARQRSVSAGRISGRQIGTLRDGLKLMLR